MNTLYLNSGHLEIIGTDWNDLVLVIKETLETLKTGDYSQPIKPYLRYGQLKNRIIAMPAYVGGNTDFAGLKWIASFPENTSRNKARAHAVTILNQSDSGEPVCIINSTLLSEIRTASVSGLLIKEYVQQKQLLSYNVGIIGLGPIGKIHLQMIRWILKDKINKIFVYDIDHKKYEQINSAIDENIVVCRSWDEYYNQIDINITCTLSREPYIDQPPKKGSLQLNISLRDYKVNIKDFVDIIIVDNWDEVCRENTDIENMHKTRGLVKEDTFSMVDVICGNALSRKNWEKTLMFNPMGLAVFDISIAGYYLKQAYQKNLGIQLPS